MNKMYIFAMVSAISLVLYGCVGDADSVTAEKTQTQDDAKAMETGEAADHPGLGAATETSGENGSRIDDGLMSLAVPEIMEGVTIPGEDAVEVCFEWDAVDGSDGYEV